MSGLDELHCIYGIFKWGLSGKNMCDFHVIVEDWIEGPLLASLAAIGQRAVCRMVIGPRPQARHVTATMLWFIIYSLPILLASSVVELIQERPFNCPKAIDLIREGSTARVQFYIMEAMEEGNPEAVKCILAEFPLDQIQLDIQMQDAIIKYLQEMDAGLQVLRHQCILVLLEDVQMEPSAGALKTVFGLPRARHISTVTRMALFHLLIAHGAPIEVGLLSKLKRDDATMKMVLEMLPEARLNDGDSWNQTPLMFAGRLADRRLAYECTESLLKRGADPNKDSVADGIEENPFAPLSNALTQALKLRRYDIVYLLFRYGAKVNNTVLMGRSLEDVYICRCVLPKVDLVLGAKLDAESVLGQMPREIVDEIVQVFLQLDHEKYWEAVSSTKPHPRYK